MTVWSEPSPPLHTLVCNSNKQVQSLPGDYVNLAGWGLQWDSDNQKYQLDSTMKLINLQVHSKEECEEDYFSADAARDAGMKPNDLRKQIPQVRHIF